MPLRVEKGVEIEVKRSPSREPPSRYALEEARALPRQSSGRRLGVATVSQSPRDEWCWAACAEMVLRFFGVDEDKCEVVGRTLERDDCCPAAPVCDVGLKVEEVDFAFELSQLYFNRFPDLDFEQVKGQINGAPSLGEFDVELAPRPIVAGIEWSGGGGHLIVISGWRDDGSTKYLKVNDPFYDFDEVPIEDLMLKYGPNNSGRWVHTWADFRRAD